MVSVKALPFASRRSLFSAETLGISRACDRPPLSADETVEETSKRKCSWHTLCMKHLFFFLVKSNNLPCVSGAASACSYPRFPVSGNTRYVEVDSIPTKNFGDGNVMNWPEFDVLFHNSKKTAFCWYFQAERTLYIMGSVR